MSAGLAKEARHKRRYFSEKPNLAPGTSDTGCSTCTHSHTVVYSRTSGQRPAEAMEKPSSWIRY